MRIAYGLAAIGIGLTGSAGAATLPYSNDFSSSSSDFTLATASGGAWTLASGTLSHDKTVSPYAGTYSAVATFAELGGVPATASDFELQAEFAALDINGTTSNVAVMALGNSTFSSGYAFASYGAVGGGGYGLRILRSGTLAASGGLNFQLRFVESVPFRLIATGEYVDTNADLTADALQLDVQLINLNTSAVVGTASYLDTSPLTGTSFGMRDTNSNTNDHFAVSWNSFNLQAVPEPAMLSGLAFLGLVGRRRGARGL